MARKTAPPDAAGPEPKGRYYIDPDHPRPRVSEPTPEYASSKPVVTVSATDAARRFSDLINRVCYEGETFVVERGGRAICQIAPVETRRCTGADLLALFATLPHPGDEFLDILEDITRNQPPVQKLPWEP
jgi:antitoxin (DNA-binding transcriptional repressor) of toxin-antitoxin stability system